MPHAALWVVQQINRLVEIIESLGFNAARGFVGGATFVGFYVYVALCCFNAARGFVGGATLLEFSDLPILYRFNAARGFVGGATVNSVDFHRMRWKFQCRTRLCGWCNRIARSPCPPREKKLFWKVSGNLSVLTENM